MSTATLKRPAKQAKSKKQVTEPAKLSPGIDQLWYAEERLISDGRFFREYKDFGLQGYYKMENLFDLPQEVNLDTPGPSVESVVSIDAPPPTHAHLTIDIRPYIFDGKLFPMVRTRVYHYGSSAEDAGRFLKSEIEQSSYDAELNLVVEVDRRGYPTKAEVARLRPLVIETVQAEIKRAIAKEKARARRASASAKKAAETRRKNAKAKGGAK